MAGPSPTPAVPAVVPMGIDLGSLNARIAVTDPPHPPRDGGGGAGEEGRPPVPPEARVVSNAQGSRHTLALAIPEEGEGMMGGDPRFVFGEAARRALTRSRRPLDEALVRALCALSISGSGGKGGKGGGGGGGEAEDFENSENSEDPGREGAAGAAGRATSAFFADLATLACDATGAAPDQLRAVVSVPPGTLSAGGVTRSAQAGLAAAAIAAGAGAGAGRGAGDGSGGKGRKKKQRKGEGGRFSGATVVGVLTDPAAVCVAHGLTDEIDDVLSLGGADGAGTAAPPAAWRHALVVDWGASGLRLSHVERLGSSRVLSLISSVSDPTLSGRALTDLLVRHCASQFERRSRVAGVLESTRSRARLEAACESAIRTLARAASCQVTVDGLYEGMDLSVPVSRPRFDMLCGPALRRAEAMISTAKDDAMALELRGGGGAAFDVVLLSGSVSLMPSAMAMVDRQFAAADDGTTAAPWRGRPNVPPNEAVAMGCARHAASLADPTRLGPSPSPSDAEADAEAEAEAEAEAQRRHRPSQDAAVLSPVAVGICSWDEDGSDRGDSSVSVPLIEIGTPLPALVARRIALDGAAALGIVQLGKEEGEVRLLGKLSGVPADHATVDITLELSEEGKLELAVDGGEAVTLC